MKTVQRIVQFPLGVEVRQSGGAYITQTIAGQRVSCTHSDQVAADRLADKLCAALALQPGTLRASKVRTVDVARTLWRIESIAAQEAS